MVAISSILVPLYIYPSVTTWEPLYSSLSSNPTVKFNIIINPLSGPGGDIPDINYKTGITKLHSYSNANLLGYVDSNWALDQASQDKAIADINTYAGWPTNAANTKDIFVNGIFFDDAPSAYTSEAYEFMKTISTTARSKSFSTIMFNPGVVGTDVRYFALADQMLIYENYYSEYKNSNLQDISSMYRANSTVVLHGFDGDAAVQKEVVDALAEDGFGGAFVTTRVDPEQYHDWSGLWNDFVTAVREGTS